MVNSYFLLIFVVQFKIHTMKKIFYLLLFLPFLINAQTMVLNDYVFNMSTEINDFSGTFDEDSTDYSSTVGGYFTGINSIVVDTTTYSVTISGTSVNLNFMLDEVTVNTAGGITYNIINLQTSNKGFIYYKEGMVQFLIQESYSFKNYFGFICFNSYLL